MSFSRRVAWPGWPGIPILQISESQASCVYARRFPWLETAGCIVPAPRDTSGSAPTDPDAANRHSLDMANTGIYSHTGSDGSTPTSRAADAGYVPGVVNELIAFSFDTPDAAVDAWMADAGQRALLLSATHVHIGASCKSIYGLEYWTVLVANP